MPKEIAAYVGENGKTASLYDQGKIIVYRKSQGAWQLAREREFTLDQNLGMRELRGKMAEALEFLAGCKVFVGLSIAGVPYFELEKARFSVWEYEGAPAEFLDSIMEEEEEKQVQAAEGDGGKIMLEPVETAAGCYHISIKEVQEKDTGYTSKQLLLPFLRKGRFYSLEVRCNHVPPWLEAELAGGDRNLSGEVKKVAANETKVLITRKCCHYI